MQTNILANAVPLVCPPDLITASKASAYTVWNANTLVNHTYHRIANEAFTNNYITPVTLSYEASWGDLADLLEAWPKETHHPIRRLRITIHAPTRLNIKGAFSELSYGIPPPDWSAPLYDRLREVVILLETEEPAKKIEDLEERLWRYLLILRRTMNGGRSGTVRLQVTRKCSISTWTLDPDGIHTRREWRLREPTVLLGDTPVSRRARMHAHLRRSLGRPLAAVLIFFGEHRKHRIFLMLTASFLCVAMIALTHSVQEGLQCYVFVSFMLLGWLGLDYCFTKRFQHLHLHGVPYPAVLDPGHDFRLSTLLVDASFSFNAFVRGMRIPSAWELLQTAGSEIRKLGSSPRRRPLFSVLCLGFWFCHSNSLNPEWIEERLQGVQGFPRIIALLLICWLVRPW
ncbi:hypothetical protein LTR27_003924 [Elasticomyces elasticus]|nr:hypothetical protein LTR27_003924 [Elasticomyces elasticus]